MRSARLQSPAPTPKSPARTLPRRVLAWRAVAVIALAAAGVLSAPVLRDEWTAAHLEAATAQDLGAPPPMPWDNGDASALCGADCPPRANAALGVHLAIMAAREPDPVQRHNFLADSQRRLTAALQIRPSSAGWWAWLAYARSLDGQDKTVFDALTRSYAAAPYLPQEGPWRTRICAANWSSLSPVLRSHVVDEAVWMREVDPVNAATVFAAFTDPAAAAALRAGLARPPAPLVPHRRSGSPGGVGATS